MIKILLMILLIIILWNVYKNIYYNGDSFKELKQSVQEYVINCNLMNQHIEELKRSYVNIAKKNNYGKAELIDASRYNYKRPEQVKAVKSEFVHECSASVLKNAERQPFKYLCKYFNIKADEQTLEQFEAILNNFSACEEGKQLLIKKLEVIKHSIENKVPFLIRIFSMNEVMSKLGFKKVDINLNYFPVYTFKYISPGGNKTSICSIVLDIENLNGFIKYLSDVVKFKKSKEGQRALMTSALRNKIKQRDNFTCKKCGISIRDEKHLLLEVDHIIPISKGGLTVEHNLQTLCWKCNRSKGAKIN